MDLFVGVIAGILIGGSIMNIIFAIERRKSINDTEDDTEQEEQAEFERRHKIAHDKIQ